VAYCLRITDLDPIENELLFEEKRSQTSASNLAIRLTLARRRPSASVPNLRSR
jgi:hypothetical protein